MPDQTEIRLNKRKQRRAEREAKKRTARNKSRWETWLVFLLYVFGFYSFIKVSHLYHDTFIGYQLPIGGGLVFGLVVSFLFNKDYRYFFAPVIPLLVIFVTIMLFINSFFADKEVVMLKEIVIAKYHHGSKSMPRATIKFRDFKRDFISASDTELDGTSYVVIMVNKGLFGYYVIRDFKLTKD